MVNNNNEALNNLGIEIIQTASLIHDNNQEEINQKLNSLLQNLHENLQQSQEPHAKPLNLLVSINLSNDPERGKH